MFIYPKCVPCNCQCHRSVGLGVLTSTTTPVQQPGFMWAQRPGSTGPWASIVRPATTLFAEREITDEEKFNHYCMAANDGSTVEKMYLSDVTGNEADDNKFLLNCHKGTKGLPLGKGKITQQKIVDSNGKTVPK